MHGLSFPRQHVNYWKTVPDAFSTAIEQFTPQMFLLCMATGIMSVLLHNNPYQFNGLGRCFNSAMARIASLGG